MALPKPASVGLAQKYFEIFAPQLASGQSVVLYGPAGVGKSLILKEIDNQLFAPYQFICIDLKKRDSNTIGSFYSILLNELICRFPDQNNNNNNFSFNSPVQILSQIELFLGKIVDPNHQLVFLFDEFEEFISDIDPLIFNNLRSLNDRFRRGIHYIFIFSNPPNSIVKYQKNDSFLDLTGRNQIRISTLTEDETDKLLATYPSFENISRRKTIIHEIYMLSGGHAGLILDCARAINHHLKISKSQVKPLVSANTAVNNRLERITINCLDPIELRHWSEMIPLLCEYIQNHEIPLPAINHKLEDITSCEFTYDSHTNQIFRQNHAINDLTAKEFHLLKYFITNPKRVCGKDEIAEAVWIGENPNGVSDEAIDKLVQRLRIKVESNPANPQIIHTIRGRGYQFCD